MTDGDSLRPQDSREQLNVPQIFKTLYPICSLYTLAVYCNYAPGFWQKMWDSLTLSPESAAAKIDESA